MIRRTQVQIGSTTVALRESDGAGPALVLVHGSAASSEVWAPLFETTLARRHRLVALDLPGCGDSGRLERYSIVGLAGAVVEIARAAGCEDGLFVGHSLGGHLLLEAAPSLTAARGFAIFGTPPIGKPPDVERAFLAAQALPLAYKADLSPDEIRAFVQVVAGPDHPAAGLLAELVRRNDPRMRVELGASLAALEYADELERVRTLARSLAVLHGEHETVVDGRYLAGVAMPTLWRGAVQVIPGAGHYAQLDRPAAVAELLGEFARSLGGA